MEVARNVFFSLLFSIFFIHKSGQEWDPTLFKVVENIPRYNNVIDR
jgi:hypothetical protein